MKSASRAICNALLDHHRTVCVGSAKPDDCLVTYGQICEAARIR